MEFALPGMDTRTLSEEGVAMEIRTTFGQTLLDKDGKPVRIFMRGPDSATYRSLTRAQVRKRVQRASGGSETSPEEDEADALDILVALTVKWEGVYTPGGEVIACTPENVRALFANYPIIREQADNFAASRVNFIKG
jgi:hypothetical protein